VDLLLNTIAQRGARISDAWEFHSLATRSDARRDLAGRLLLQAPTARTASILLHEWTTGALLIGVETILNSTDGQHAAAQTFLAGLMRYTQLGRHLVEPWRVTLAGAPNFGKSSLVNALAGYQRSIVSPTPGTTRDVVTTTIALDGWPVELADTAGLRSGAGALEGQGIEHARSAVLSADLCLWVLDAAAEPVWPDLPAERVLLVVNKTDLAPTWDLNHATGAVPVSALTGSGIPQLCEAIVRRLVPCAPGPTEPVSFTPELCDRVEEARTHAVAGRWDDVRRVVAAMINSPGKVRP
jgi:tRNA modification GTPase